MSDKDKDKKRETIEMRCPTCGGRMVEYKGVYRCPECDGSEDTARILKFLSIAIMAS